MIYNPAGRECEQNSSDACSETPKTRDRIMDHGGQYAGTHEQCTWNHDGFAGLVHGPSMGNEKARHPTTQETAGICGNIRDPRKEADLFEVEAVDVKEIQRQPGDVEPPDRIGQESRQHNGPYLAVFKKFAPAYFAAN